MSLSPTESATAPVMNSRTACAQAMLWGFHTAMQRGARSITCVLPGGPDWADGAACAAWPLDDPALLQGLTTWLRRPQRRLVLLAAGYDHVPRLWPRFTNWRRDWTHALSAWQAPSELAANLPVLLLDDQDISVHLIDSEHWRGRAMLDVRTRVLWAQKIDVVLQRSELAFAVNTLGL
jgi:hypothetical protein